MSHRDRRELETRVAVVGATGQIGSYAVSALERAGHDVVPISRSTGVDAFTGAKLGEALTGVDAVIDATNNRSQDEAEIVALFGATSRNLLAAEQRAGVHHHVLLSVAGLEHGQRVPHYSGKREQERLVTAGRFRGASCARRNSTNSRQGSPTRPNGTGSRPLRPCSSSRSHPPTSATYWPTSRPVLRSTRSWTSPVRKLKTSWTWRGLSAIQDVGGLALTGLGGALVPLAVLPAWVHGLAQFSPGYWGVQSMRWALDGNASGVLCAELALGCFAGAAIAAAAWRIRRGWQRRQVM